jgi:hypothetical protein
VAEGVAVHHSKDDVAPFDFEPRVLDFIRVKWPSWPQFSPLFKPMKRVNSPPAGMSGHSVDSREQSSRERERGRNRVVRGQDVPPHKSAPKCSFFRICAHPIFLKSRTKVVFTCFSDSQIKKVLESRTFCSG